MKQQTEKKRVLCALQNTNSVDRYTFCIVDIVKHIETNKIIKAVIPKGLLRESIIFDDLRHYIRTVFTNKKPDYVISTQQHFMQDSYFYDLYSRKDEHELAKLYIDNFEVLVNRCGTLQQVSNGEGLFLTDGDSQKSKWKFDHTSLRMATFAFMFSIDLVSRNKTSRLLMSLKEE